MKRDWKPNLFVPGVPRGGTTSWYEYFKLHPEIYQPFEKSPSYFGDHPDPMKPENFHNIKKYYEIYKNALNKKYKYRTDLTHLLHSKSAPKEIYEFNPDAKFIIILRNPIEAIQSKWNLTRKSNKDLEFKDYLNTRDGRMMLESVRYFSNLKRFFKYFPREQVYVIKYEWFQKSSSDIFRKACKFLGIKEINAPSYKYNALSQPINQWIRKGIDLIPLRIRFSLRNNLPLSIVERIRRIVLKLTHKPIRPKQIPPQQRQKLLKLLKPEIEKTEKLLGLDLSSWKK